MQAIIPHLWYDTEAKEAVAFYVELFGGKIDWTYTITDTPSGDADLVQFQLGDMTLAAISAGPYFKLNESMSLMVNVASKDDVSRLYEALSDGGRVLVPLAEYPFSPYYVWLEDRFGLSWQLSYEPDLDVPYSFDICLLFSQDQVGLAQPMLDYYKDKLPQARLGRLSYYGEGEAAVAAAKLNYAELFIGDQKIIAMDHGYGAEASFNEAFSLMVYVDSQDELDFYYDLLSAVPEAEICGWGKDQFGISWQIVPRILMEAYDTASPEKVKAVNAAVMTMKRLDIAAIQELLN
ncbi:TPA: VOC family protein [Streptococcus suis]|nr:VOC family protein [Streptococcus suis]HEM5057849.1 VOC family protein [Streptococcus suis]HEM5068308.1 VOC family protein [Streptococcus suis]HEM5164972.1 VOC family protein [Streptococcus suis]HEM5287653.1 VOC family protein [Streptococcus suis]